MQLAFLEAQMDFRKMFRVEPDRKFRLADIDPGYHGEYASEEAAQSDLEEHKKKMALLQRKLYGEGARSLLIVLQGMDASGKDGTVSHVLSGLNPLGVRVTDFKAPTKQELSHDFLWRIHAHAPGKGEIAIFNRSHYEDVLIARVHKLVKKPIWRARYDFINDWENLLHHDNETTILKFFLHISKQEQLQRLEQRMTDPARLWKISKSDYAERAYWDDYMEAYEEVFERCSTEQAPWYVIPADHKWFRNIAISQIIAATMDDLDFQLPKPPADIDEIRKLHQAAVEEANSSAKKKNKH
jgi:PPK2 family polyphosphate:nucleotide phosphotransferase